MSAFLLLIVLLSGPPVRLPKKRRFTMSSPSAPPSRRPSPNISFKALKKRPKRGADGLIIRLDTPGGLDLAMRDIAKGILNASLPVIVYVSPAGARAASAGVIITVAAHIAAMAPGTNIGAAHPVAIGIGGGMDKTMSTKVENDAVAYVIGIAKKRGRNEEWVEKAVRKSESITAEEALRFKVIDFVADDLNHLLEQADGKKIRLPTGEKILRTKGRHPQREKDGNPSENSVRLERSQHRLYPLFARAGRALF